MKSISMQICGVFGRRRNPGFKPGDQTNGSEFLAALNRARDIAPEQDRRFVAWLIPVDDCRGRWHWRGE